MMIIPIENLGWGLRNFGVNEVSLVHVFLLSFIDDKK